MHLSGHYFNASPMSKEQLDIGRNDFVLVRSAGAQGFGFAGDARVQAHRMFSLSFGADYVQEFHQLQTFDQRLTRPVLAEDGSVLRKQGTIIPGEAKGAERTFYDAGVFLQGFLNYRSFSAIVGGRYDYHNIYGSQFSTRAGLVYAPQSGRVSLKLLYGSAFKAPSAEQLFTQPITALDIQGNPNLKQQTAHTIEAFAGFALPQDRGEVSLNAFATLVLGRVEFTQRGQFLQATNAADEWLVGGELDSRLVIAKGLTMRLSASVARTVARTAGTTVVGLVESRNQLFPMYQVHWLGDYAIPWGGLHLSGEISYVGPRAASQSNALLLGATYERPGYFFTALSLTRSGRLIPNRNTYFAIRVSDLVNVQWTEPGFSGVDVPTQGTTLMITVNQQL
jgi:hypothetical protein